MARIWEFLGSPSFEELERRTLYDLIGEKEEELQRRFICSKVRPLSATGPQKGLSQITNLAASICFTSWAAP